MFNQIIRKMSKENFETLKGTIEAIEPADTKTPYMPVDTYLGEATDLYNWSKNDQAQLTHVGVPQIYFDEFKPRIGALRYAQAEWYEVLDTKKKAQEKWDEESPKAYDLKNEIEHSFLSGELFISSSPKQSVINV